MQMIRRALSLVPLLFLAVFLFYPLAVLFAQSFAPKGTLSISGLADLVSDSYYVRVLWFTTWQAALSTLLTLGAAFPAAYVFARFQFPGKGLWRALATLPFLMPTVVTAAAFSSLLGPRGWVNSLLMTAFHLETAPIRLLNTVGIILLAHVFYNYSVVLRIVGDFWARLDPHLEQAARVLGAGPLCAWRQVTLPLLAPATLAAALLVFTFDFTSFGIVLLLGGPRLATLEVEIYRQTVSLFNLPLASTLALLQMACTFALMLVYARLQARLARPLSLNPHAVTQRPPAARGERVLLVLVLGSLFVLVGAPLLTLIVDSLSVGGGYGLENYTRLFENPRGSISFVPPVQAVRNSLLFGLAVVVLAVGLGLGAAYSLLTPRGRRARLLLDAVYMLPLGTSGVTLGFGYIIALDKPPLDLRATVYLVPIAHALIAFPFVVRSLLPILRGIRPQLRQAAGVLGATPLQVWREVDLPILARAIAVGAVYAFVISLGEFGATALITLPEFPTLPVAIFRLLGQPGVGNYGQAIALSVILMVISVFVISGMERARMGEWGEF